MSFDRGLLMAVERAVVRGWPATDAEIVDGWLARHATGGSVRANSVATLAFEGHDMGAAIARVEGFYRRHDAPARFSITDVSMPADLDAALAIRGYARSADHVTMMKAVGVPADVATEAAPATIAVVSHQDTTPGWYGIYLQGLSDSRRAIAPAIVERVPKPRLFLSAVRDGDVIGSGLTVLDGDVASVQCMATLTTARRTGAARSILAAIERHAGEHGARWLYLQTEAGNTPAVALYERAGFTPSGRYHTRDQVV